MKVVSFVAAASNSGKTTLVEKIVRLLKKQGLRVAVIKHASKGFELDRPGKDSWRFQEAGADAVVLAGPDRMAVIKKLAREPSQEELLSAAGDADIVLYEGFKTTAHCKIEVFRFGISGNQPLCFADHSFRALVSDRPFAVPIPRFDLNDADGITDFLIKEL